MKTYILILNLLTLIPCVLHAQRRVEPVGFVETWVLADDRAATLKELVPGTENSYFFHALHYQQTKQQKKFKSTMAAWKLAIDQRKLRSSQRYDVMETRGIILDYEKDPAGSIARLRELLGFQLDIRRPIPPEDADIPSVLDPQKISPAAFRKKAAKEGEDYETLSEHLLYAELKDVKNFDRAKRLWFLGEIKRTDFPEIPQLILAELQHASKPRFGSIPGTQYLLLGQLLWLEKQHPALLSDVGYVTAVLDRMRPGGDAWQLHHPKETMAWLTRQWEFCSRLPVKMNPLKIRTVHALLDAHRKRGAYPENPYLEYLALTSGRAVPVRKRALREGLERDYLYHILAKKKDIATYEKYISEGQLTRIHAEAQLMAGASTEQWGKKLQPEQFRKLRDKTEVELLISNANQWSATDQVSLKLQLKNASALTVRIFELDSLAHVRSTGGNPSVDMKLNGLVPHHERVVKFQKPSIVRHDYTLKLPRLSGRGVWIVECISQGVSCRALVRKGHLHLLSEAVAGAQRVTILDEKLRPAAAAELYLGGQKFTADAKGRITLPLANAKRNDSAILFASSAKANNDPALPEAMGLAVATVLERLPSQHKLKMEVGAESEQLLAGKKADLYIRPQLSNNNLPVPFSKLENPRINITATLRGGVRTDVSDVPVKLPANGILRVPITVPSELRELTVVLQGELSIPGRKEPLKLTAESTVKVNNVNSTMLTGQAFLSKTTKGWVLDLLGRNGEPMPQRVLNLEVGRNGFDNVVALQMKTDAQGQIQLGELQGIYGIEVADTKFFKGISVDLDTYGYGGPEEIYARVGEAIHLLPAWKHWLDNIHLHYGLLSHHGNSTKPVAELNKHLSRENDELVIKGLPAGQYILKESGYRKGVKIRVIDAEKNGKWLHGKGISLSHHNPTPFHITNAKVGGENNAQHITATLRGDVKNTRVIAMGVRYFHEYDHHSMLALTLRQPPMLWQHGYLAGATVNGRTLSDEYRYILERRQAKHFPGNMLERPSLLLHPRKEISSKQSSYGGLDSEAGRMNHASQAESRAKKGGIPATMMSRQITPSYDFLAKSSVVKMDVELAKDGTIKLPLKGFEHCQSISLVALSETDTASVMVALPPVKLTTRDQRLDRNLNPKKHYSGNRATAILRKGAKAEIHNVLDADWRAYTSLSHVYDYYIANGGVDHLRSFVHLMRWPKLNEKQRRGAAHLLASHEFHLFAYFKNRKWFDANIKPLLKHKRHRRFVDDFLLGEDLTPYLTAWKYNKLNAAEKALLAHALPAKRKAIIMDMENHAALREPTPEHETLLFASALRQNSMAMRDRLGFAKRDLALLERAEQRSAGIAYIHQYLNNTVIPKIEWENITLSEAIDQLVIKAAELNGGTAMNMVLRNNESDPVIKSLKLTNVPMHEVLQNLSEMSGYRMRIDDYGVTYLPLTDSSSRDLVTRAITVPPGFMDLLNQDQSEGDDPFGGGNDDGDGIKPRMSAKDALKRSGISFPDGATVVYNPATNTLIVKNTRGNLDVVDQLTSALRMKPAENSRQLAVRTKNIEEESSNDPFGGGVRESMLDSDDGGDDDAFAASDGADDGGADPFSGGDAEGDELLPPPPEAEELLTYVYEESYYYNHDGKGNAMVKMNRFWLEFARHAGKKEPFLSTAFPECSDTPAGMLLALAVLDLPFEGQQPNAKIENLTLKVEAKSRMLLFFRDTRETNKLAKNSPLLVRQNFFRHGDRTREDAKGKEQENPIDGEFLTGIPYTASFIITNPTGMERNLQVLTQIPRGAIPLGARPATDAKELRIKAHATQRVEYSFYFPSAGSYPHFPAHVLESGVVQAFAEAEPLKVVNQASKKDTRSWLAVALDGTNSEVLARMKQENLRAIELGAILWRCSKKSFYQKAVAILRERLHFHSGVYAYGFKHGDEVAVRTFLENAAIIDELGGFFQSKLVSTNDLERGHWSHLEFTPLVNPRKHAFQGVQRSYNAQADDQYLTILDAMAWKPSLTQDDLLTLTYHLFLQDRVEEALKYFHRIKRAKVNSKMQYDYLHCYALFYQEKAAEAAKIAQSWKNSPAVRWRDRFDVVIRQAAEIAGHSKIEPNDGKKAAAPESLAASLEISPDKGRLRLDYQSLKQATLRLYSVDLEVLFSESPFLNQQSEISPSIKPNSSITVDLPAGKKQYHIPLPKGLSRGNVLAVVESGGLKRATTLDSSALQGTLSQLDHTIRVTETNTGKVLPRTYVKVYAQMNSGETVFYKDGYTDLRGKFPYRTHTGVSASEVKRYAIFISHPEHGSRVIK